jgi:hypothetical protein
VVADHLRNAYAPFLHRPWLEIAVRADRCHLQFLDREPPGELLGEVSALGSSMETARVEKAETVKICTSIKVVLSVPETAAWQQPLGNHVVLAQLSTVAEVPLGISRFLATSLRGPSAHPKLTV